MNVRFWKFYFAERYLNFTYFYEPGNERSLTVTNIANTYQFNIL